MSLQSLSDPLSGDLPAGEDCELEIQSQNLALLNDYLVERAVQKARDRAADEAGLDEGEARNAAALRDDGRRRLGGLETILKDVLQVSAVSVEQVAKALRDKASALLAHRGKDLRLVPYLGMACTSIDGLSGYADAVKLAASLLKAYPQHLFPLPDADDPADLWQRANAVSELVSGDGALALLGSVVVIEGKQAGRVTFAELVGGLRDDMPATEIAQADLDMVLSEVGPERVQQLVSAFRGVEADVASVVFEFGPGSLPTPRLADKFRRAALRVSGFKDGSVAAVGQAEAVAAPGVAISTGSASSVQGGLRSQEDARRAIQDVIRFIEKLEPGHPAPLLLKRAHRMLGMSFLDIIKDMAPGALSDIERIVGSEPSE